MGLGHSPSIIVDGLIFHIDPNNPRCYSGSGNTIYNLVNPSIGGTFVGFTANPIDNTETRSLAYNGSTTYQEFYPIEPTRLTVSVWFKATGAPSLNDIYGGTILASSPQYYISFGMLYRWTTNTVLFVQSQNGEIISANAPANKIVNAVYTYDGTNTRLYIDGVLASTVAYTTDPQYFGSGNRNLQLGRWGHPGYERYFNGNIYQASIYNRALSASEILQNYNAKRKKFYPEENIVSDGLIFNIDANKNLSYPGTGNTIYDLSGSGQTGTFTNGPIFSGLNGGYISFDGTNDYIDYPRSSLYDFGSSDFTIMYWINTTTKDTYNAVIDLNDAGGKMIIGTYNNLSWMWFTSSYNIVGTINLCDGIWHQATISRIGSTLTHYVDGRVSVSTNVGATVVPSNNFFSIGRLVQTSSYGEIKLADVKIYKNRGLTQQEIQQNYNATKGRFLNALPPVRNSLILELDALSYSGFGNTWYDLSGSNNTSALTNGPTYTYSDSLSNFLFESSDYVVVNSNADLLSKTEYTKFIFFYATSFSTANNLISGGVSGTNHAFWLNFSNRLYAGHNGSWSTVTGSTTLSTNTWYCGAVTYSNVSGWKLYLNGVLDGNSATSTTFDNNGELLIAAYANANVFTGRISLAMVYNRALSAYEIKQNFDYYRTRYNI
jgi:hypothetical protein